MTLPFSQAQLFEVVSNVGEYDHFVPYCIGSRVLSEQEAAAHAMARTVQQRQPQQDSRSSASESQTRFFLAELTVGFGKLRESYTSRVTLVGQEHVIVRA